jgi:hypothetical protein
MITNSGSKGAWGRLLLCAPAMLLLTACAVKLVDTGYGLSGGPITNTGTISIDTGVTDARYARLNAANTFNGDQLINGTLGATVSGGPSGTNSLRFNAFSNSDTVSLESSVGSGQALHIYCKIPNADCYGIWVEGASLGGLFEGKSTGVIANGPTAGRFHGAVEVLGTLTKSAGAFKIDHPLDPENKYLVHSFVESPDMMNIYNGLAVLDGKGEAWVSLPDWFQALNADFRYQLTAIGKAAPNLHVATEVTKSRFRIAGGPPRGRVSWQVTGIRHDAYAEAHRIVVEEAKAPEERGYYLHPDLFKQPPEKGVFMRESRQRKPRQAP